VKKVYAEKFDRFIFRRADGKYLSVREEIADRAILAEWTDDAFEATKFYSESGLGGDHRWPTMSKDCSPVRVSIDTSSIVTIPDAPC
jgi:hypothetical protein